MSLTLYEKILNHIYNYYGDHLPDQLYVRMRFRVTFHKRLHLHHPRTFYEKINWLKFYDRQPEYKRMADKYDVRGIVTEKVGSQYLIPLLGHWKRVEDIPWDSLPGQFVLKCSHDSSSIVICTNKDQMDREAAMQKLDQALHTDYSRYGREWVYSDPHPTIIAEKYMVDDSGTELRDYKVFCFNGEPRIIEFDYNRFVGHKRRILTTDWERIPVKITYPDDLSYQPPKPAALQEMLDLCRRLSAGIPFVRTDCYIINGRVYFGELTFYPGGGFEPMDPYDYDVLWGSYLTLPDRNR